MNSLVSNDDNSTINRRPPDGQSALFGRSALASRCERDRSRRPADRARGAYAEPQCRLAAGHPALYCFHHTATKIKGKRLGHACRPPSPARSLNQIGADSRIPFDSVGWEIALECRPLAVLPCKAFWHTAKNLTLG